MSTEIPNFPDITEKDVLALKFTNWHCKLEAYLPQTKVISVDKTHFEEFINSEGIFISDTYDPQYNEAHLERFSDSEDDWSADEEDMEEEKKGIQLSEPIQNEIQQAIEELGGKVIPRMGWSFPTDAGWIISTNGSIQCENVNQVMMVLKASDKISRDIEKPYGLLALSDNNAGDKFEIVLNRFINTDLGQEFRVFVRNKRVIAISKVDEEMPSQQGNVRVQSYDEIKSKIIKLFNKAIKEAIETSNYTFDVYIVSGNKGSRTYILGFKLFAPINSAKMFDWDELLTISEDVSEEDVEIRTAITSQNRGQRTGTTVSKRYPIQYPLELNSSKSLANIIDEMA